MASDGGADFDRVMRNLRRKTATLPGLLGGEVLVSIRDGSAITGAPGQPRDDGDLIASWKVSRTQNAIRIFSRLFYAPFAEEGATPKGGPFIQRSTRGGPHSVKQTRVGLQRLLDNLVQQLGKAGS